MLNFSQASQEDAEKVSLADPLSLCLRRSTVPEAEHLAAGPWAVCLHLCSHTQWVGDLSALTKENPPPPGTWFCSLVPQPAAVPSITNRRLQSSDPLTWPECHPRWAGGGVGSKQAHLEALQGPTGQLAGVPRWGCTLGLGDRDLICKFPLSPARESDRQLISVDVPI